MAADGNKKPELLTLLICEQALNDESGVTSLIRVVDTFNFDIETFGGEEEQQSRVAVSLRCTVYTRWGLGEGEFEEGLALVYPDGKEDPQKGLTKFTKPPGFHFQQVRHGVNVALSESGVYAWRVYLDGEFVRDHPFQVNINVSQRPIKQEPL